MNGDRGGPVVLEQVAPDLLRLRTGRLLGESNVYLIGSGASCVLVDTAWSARAATLRTVVEAVAGPARRPAAILLTHIHPDHSGAAFELASGWGLPVHVHPAEVPQAAGGIRAGYENPLDTYLIEPLVTLMRKPVTDGTDPLARLVRAFDPTGAVPGLPDWRCVPTPGHTPGHVAFFRPADGVLITGDAVLTVNLNSVPELLLRRHRLAGPPRITSWNWDEAGRSVARLAELEPTLLAPGHGRPMGGPGTARALADLARRLRAQRTPAQRVRSRA